MENFSAPVARSSCPQGQLFAGSAEKQECQILAMTSSILLVGFGLGSLNI
jgi:hypothetical protein